MGCQGPFPGRHTENPQRPNPSAPCSSQANEHGVAAPAPQGGDAARAARSPPRARRGSPAGTDEGRGRRPREKAGSLRRAGRRGVRSSAALAARQGSPQPYPLPAATSRSLCPAGARTAQLTRAATGSAAPALPYLHRGSRSLSVPFPSRLVTTRGATPEHPSQPRSYELQQQVPGAAHAWRVGAAAIVRPPPVFLHGP